MLDAFDNELGTYYGFDKNTTYFSHVFSGGAGYLDEWKACERNGTYAGPKVKDLILAHLSYVNDNPDRWDKLDYDHIKTKKCDLDRQNYIYAKSTPDGYELI